MQTKDDVLIRVHDGWDGWHNAEVPSRELHNVHWLQPARAPRPLLHAYVSCASITVGEIPHNCRRDATPHTLLVCVLKRHSPPSIYAELARRADGAASAPDPRSVLISDRRVNE